MVDQQIIGQVLDGNLLVAQAFVLKCTLNVDLFLSMGSSYLPPELTTHGLINCGGAAAALREAG